MRKREKAENNNKRLKVVTIGGGTGHAVLLEGLKKYPIQLTAVVSMADDGGSGGKLRDELGVLPPGDVRMCLIALSEAPQRLRTLFQYRFENGNVSGHTLGNLFLSALEKTSNSFTEAIATAGRILKVYGRVIPVSEEDMRLVITLKDGSTLLGEHYLNDNELVREKGVEGVALENTVTATPSALSAIVEADVVVIGPGGLYDSLLPPLLVEGIPEAIQNTSGKVMYVANLTNKKGQTENFAMDDYVDAIHNCLGRDIDAVICNNMVFDTELLEKYEEQEGKNAVVVCKEINNTSYELVFTDVLADDAPKLSSSDAIAKSRSLIRHDSDKLAQAVVEYIEDHA